MSSAKVLETVRGSQTLGVDVVDVRITRVDYVEAITESVYRRMEAERKRVANEFALYRGGRGRKIRADADRQRDHGCQRLPGCPKTEGEGDAEAARIMQKPLERIPNSLSSIAAWKPTRQLQ